MNHEIIQQKSWQKEKKTTESRAKLKNNHFHLQAIVYTLQAHEFFNDIQYTAQNNLNQFKCKHISNKTSRDFFYVIIL